METEQRVQHGVKKSGEPYRIMIVDDSLFVQKQMGMIFSAEGFEILATASDGQEAVEKYREHQEEIDLITMDITMPKMDGITALGKLLEINPKVAVVMVSALGKEDLVKKSLIMGAKNYIVKPLNREKVIERMASILKNMELS